MKRHVYLLALLLTAALLVGCGHKAQPDTDADPNAQEALPPEETVAEEQIAGVVDSAHQSL